jgi:hypothetical protein
MAMKGMKSTSLVPRDTDTQAIRELRPHNQNRKGRQTIMERKTDTYTDT